jgi:hypothetical protein
MRSKAVPLAGLAFTACSTSSSHGAADVSPTAAASFARAQAPTSTPAEVTTVASYARTQPGSLVGSGAGSISGRVNCACDGLPAQDVTQTVPGQFRWKIVDVPPGQYYVYAAGRHVRVPGGTYGDAQRFTSGYTKAITCGLL